MDIRREAEAAKVLLANIKDIVADDPEALHDAIEGETGLIEAIGEAVTRIIEIKALDEALGARAKRISERRARLDAQAERLRTAIVVAMGDVDIKKIELPEATISRKAVPPKCIVTDEAALPSRFLVEKVSVTPDKKALLEALKAGEAVPGATLSNASETLAIREG